MHAPARRLSLARVSILRGEGPRLGTPCIDDYVRAVEPIYDHLTRYRCVRVRACGPVGQVRVEHHP